MICFERVTKIENIKTDATKILRPTGFSWSKNIKTDVFFVGLNLWLFFFQIQLVGLYIYLLFILENKTEALKTDNRVMYTTYIRIMFKTAKCYVTKSKYKESVKTVKISIINTQLTLNKVMYTTYIRIMSKIATC